MVYHRPVEITLDQGLPPTAPTIKIEYYYKFSDKIFLFLIAKEILFYRQSNHRFPSVPC